MRSIILKDKYGIVFTRVSKREAEKRFNAGEEICLVPCKVDPRNEWGVLYCVEKDEEHEDFEKIVNAFSYYNCNSELGNYVAYYTKERK